MTATAAPASRDDHAAATFLSHPRALTLLFFVEMWERFSYYGMRALLVLYLTKHFLLSDEHAYAIYGSYTALVFMTPVIGGVLADRVMGARRAVLFGGMLLAAGHLLMAIEGDAGGRGVAYASFHLALALIIAGVGFLKANISALVGALYDRDDPRRDAGFTLFYVGINIGAALGPILCGLLGELYGWSWGFGAAGVGMALGLAAFLRLQSMLGNAGRPPDTPSRARDERLILLGTLLALPLIALLLDRQALVGVLLVACSAITVASILWTAARRLAPDERRRLAVALVLIAVQPLFWGLYEQAGSSLNLFTDRHVDRRVLGMEVPASLFLSLPAIYVVLLAPLFAWGWQRLARIGREPSATMKFGLALAQVGAGFLVLATGAIAAPGEPVAVIYILLLYLLHVTGELCLSPVGLSAVSRLAVPQMVGLLLGTWFLATAAGNFIAGQIAQFTGGGASDAATVIAVYTRIGWIAVATGAAVLAIAPLMRRLERG